ncbi:hypothetical protein LWI28_016731 [Acer negundo]|uniref:Uncharacterized protein n=1 Tax=Acer negundo TaxID=4023 RepID=A0AAD5NJW1_ACENE|nr:hypothetical protein LWI28_016731 [Acer negundo]
MPVVVAAAHRRLAPLSPSVPLDDSPLPTPTPPTTSFSFLGSLYFDVDEEKVHDLPMPAIHVDFRRRFRYFGESRDHLHLIEIYGLCTTLFNVYKMERDYSGWMVKHRVDLLSIATAFPEMVRSYRDPLMEYLCYYGFLILSIVKE